MPARRWSSLPRSIIRPRPVPRQPCRSRRTTRATMAGHPIGLKRKGSRPMKIVVFGPDKRTGALHDGNVVDLSHACAKYLREREGEPSPLQMAEALVPSDLARLIEGGTRALEHAQKALDYLFAEAQDKFGPRGETVVYPAANVRLHAPRPDNARIACAGGNFADHAAAMAVK